MYLKLRGLLVALALLMPVGLTLATTTSADASTKQIYYKAYCTGNATPSGAGQTWHTNYYWRSSSKRAMKECFGWLQTRGYYHNLRVIRYYKRVVYT